MKLYGTTTSPFVRRVRVVAAEVGEEVEMIDTATPGGQAALRRASPIWRVPVAEIDGRLLFDSRVIIDWLVVTRGYGGMTPPRDRWREHNLVNATDAALDSMIQLFYLRRDGAVIDGLPYAVKQVDRSAAIFEWLADQLGGGLGFDAGFGISDLSLICALDWMDFRQAYPTDRHPRLTGFRAACSERPHLVATRPVA